MGLRRELGFPGGRAFVSDRAGVVAAEVERRPLALPGVEILEPADPVEDALAVGIEEQAVDGEVAVLEGRPEVALRQVRKIRGVLLDKGQVENGELFTDPAGILCGYQFLRINDASKFLGRLNQMAGLLLMAEMGGGGRPIPEGARGIVWAATLPAGGRTGGFYRDGKPIDW